MNDTDSDAQDWRNLRGPRPSQAIGESVRLITCRGRPAEAVHQSVRWRSLTPLSVFK
jgi:hypothetical protein